MGSRFPSSLLAQGFAAAACLAAGIAIPEARAQERPAAAVLVDHLCAKTLGRNEEDRLFGILSVTVRSTIRYAGGRYSPDLIDDAIADSLAALQADCPRLAAIDDPRRLGALVQIVSQRTTRLASDTKSGYSPKQMDKASAADLSEELSSREIDAWLDALTPRERALALFLYASDVTPADIARSVGIAPGIAASGMAATKTSLLRYFHQESDSTNDVAGSQGSAPGSMPGGGPAMEFRMVEGFGAATPPLAQLIQPGSPVAVRITGISSALYGGWSLLATVTGLQPQDRLDIREPFLVLPDAPGRKRMIVVGADEISDPAASPRRFLLKAFAIDAELDGSGLRDGFHLGEPMISNSQALATLQNPRLSYIERTRCLYSDYGTGADPGLCR